ncbi:MAG: peptide chain release factor N(5)-glutamine methyltransferase [Candidatus Binatus sp.]|uniref:peptide chain release factor N(5)-glutamine methyltransferase n=1 Tax=Candidatus Binatus sp. TaxID=2811406 RepID=UPI003BAED261
MRDLARMVLVAIGTASRKLANVGIDSSLLDAELLMASAAGVTREEAITGSIELSDEILYKFETFVARREKREPTAYILGHKEFYSLDFEVTPAVLIPRPETEFVVGEALEYIKAKPVARVLDIGTGSGAIAIAIAANAPRAQITAVDISPDALAVASRNVRRHRVEDRVTLRRADCFDVLDGGAALGTFDAIVSNPPYLDDVEITALEPDVRHYEPHVALSGGVGGLRVIRKISSGAGAHLETGGELIMEMGLGHASDVVGIMVHAGLLVLDVINDFAGQMRVARARVR